ncbi:hypothetical protein LR48_Vigan04g039400 [Vigna angularis]|uniref:Uncharacterized protein n=1 Tax=Phaseolus angularis TaxID=3914 RepID=A0A0L9UBW4_PHAAN|nr:hypothetical protein LR48_Vigan04g039400 [Vigna angularis]
MGYRNVKDLWYSLGRGPVLEDCLEPLLDDKGACHLINIAMLNGEAHLYVIHRVCEPEYLLQLEYFSEPQIDRPSDEGEVERDSADLQVDRPSVEGQVERESAEKEVQIEIGVADVEAVGEAEVQTIAPEVDVLADIEGMVEDVEDVGVLDVGVEDAVEDVGVEAEVEVEDVGVEAEVEVEDVGVEAENDSKEARADARPSQVEMDARPSQVEENARPGKGRSSCHRTLVLQKRTLRSGSSKEKRTLVRNWNCKSESRLFLPRNWV